MNKIFTWALCALSLTAHAEFYDGNALYEGMRGSRMDKNAALGYVMGVADTVRGISFCPPPNVTAGQLGDTVQLYLAAVPDKRHYTGDSIVIAVISESWPCTTPKKGKSL